MKSFFKAVWMLESGSRIEWYSTTNEVYLIVGTEGYAKLDVDPTSIWAMFGCPKWN